MGNGPSIHLRGGADLGIAVSPSSARILFQHVLISLLMETNEPLALVRAENVPTLTHLYVSALEKHTHTHTRLYTHTCTLMHMHSQVHTHRHTPHAQGETHKVQSLTCLSSNVQAT